MFILTVCLTCGFQGNFHEHLHGGRCYKNASKRLYSAGFHLPARCVELAWLHRRVLSV